MININTLFDLSHPEFGKLVLSLYIFSDVFDKAHIRIWRKNSNCQVLAINAYVFILCMYVVCAILIHVYAAKFENAWVT